MTDLTRRTLLDPLALDGRDYFASLLAEGQRCGLLSDRDLSRLQGESLTLLAERADAWSHGLSTSLPAERAQQLLGSVLYIVSLELKAGPTPEEAVERLRREPLAALYAAGQKRITRKLQAARTLHRQLKKTLFPTPNQFYRATLADGVDGFFKLYRPALAAQEIHITADYPTFFGLPPLDGVEFMEEYLRCLSHENRFLRCFAPETVHALLLGLDENYPLLILNLYGPVLAAALECDPRAELIAIHDGARPLVRPEMIDEMIRAGWQTQAAAPSTPVTDTVKVADDDRWVASTPDRSTLYAVQTPQVFQANILKAALQAALASGEPVTDDCAAVERLGKRVWLAEGDVENIKITTPVDLIIVEALLRQREDGR